MRAIEIFQGSDAEATKAYYAQISARGILGEVAMNRLRAQKASARAKVYRGGVRGVGSFRRMAYERKSWSMQNLCAVLDRHGTELRIRFGWKMDSSVVFGERSSWVLYIELPGGQVSFHSPARLSAHDFSGEWDGKRLSEERILAFCDQVFWGPSKQRGLFDALAFDNVLPMREAASPGVSASVAEGSTNTRRSVRGPSCTRGSRAK